MSGHRIVIMAGGTGGHVYPALAVARRLREHGWQVSWLGTAEGLEARVAPANDIELDCVRVRGIRRGGLLSWLALPWRLGAAVMEARTVLRRRRPQVVLGLGGYASGPGGIAARLARLPLVIHEQNAVAGLTNRVLARFASHVFAGFPDSFPSGVGAETVGNPVRSELQGLPEPEQRFAGRRGPIRVLILGGSQGARSLNQQLPLALARLPAGRITVRHQCGERWVSETQGAWDRFAIEVRVEAFIEDMAEAWQWADVAICRAGALTIAELTTVGVGAVLIPLPSAADDHQTANARWLEQGGAGRVVPQKLISGPDFEQLVDQLTRERDRLLEMAVRARRMARPEADRRMAEVCEAIVSQRLEEAA